MTEPVVETVVATEPVTPAPAPAEPVKTEAAPVVEPAKVEEAPAAPVVPEKYELKVPEKYYLSNDSVEKIAAFAKEKGLTQEAAQAVLDRENESVANFRSSQEESYKKVVDGWAQQVQSDPEMGGAKFAETAESARRALKQFASEDFVKMLDQTGLGNHPELVRTFSRINKQMANDKFVRANEPAVEQKSRAQKIYGG